MCHVCPTCGGKGTVWDRTIRMARPCPRCGGSGSGLSR
jgi:DnaJ-class molecular chaperone